MSESGQLFALPHRSIAVRFTPVSGIDSRSQALPSRATSGLMQCNKRCARVVRLFDHVVGAGEQRGRHLMPNGHGRSQVDGEIELGRLLHRQIGRLGTFQYLCHVAGSAPIQVRIFRAVGQTASGRTQPGSKPAATGMSAKDLVMLRGQT